MMRAGAGAGAGRRPIALVTGGAKRVGRAICLALAAPSRGAPEGCDVVFTYRTSTRETEALLGELADAGVRAEARRLDLDDLASIEGFCGAFVEDFGGLDVLVHNASMYEASPVGSIAPEDAERQMRVNALGALLLTQGFAPALSKSALPGGGSVVALVDIHAMGRPRRDHVVYAMSKAGLVEMCFSLARDLAPRVRVNMVAPGAVIFAEQGVDADPEMRRRYLSRVPLGRVGTPEEAAEAARWLALDATYCTGEVVRVDGGRWLG